MAQIKTDFPYRVREIENAWIPMPDGARLAARLWLPEDAARHPVPAVLEYLPYRKNDGTAYRDSLRHPYFAGHGYACLRVDMRGSGDSDGILYDEYLPQEQDDALEVLKWAAAQNWCSGQAGIIGISWGGFNGLQIAARRPPELKAVISLCSTDDRYSDDVHYIGGCVLAHDMLAWASAMLAFNAQPPDPRFVGERWREIWLERMEQSPPFIQTWLSHQQRDDYWKHGSVCQNYGDITCPVFAVGGWADGYTNAIPRLLAGLPGPRKGLIGPWAHAYPEVGVPGPAIGFLQECLRWWDYWLKGKDTGIMEEPMLRAWIQESAPPASVRAIWPGHWVAESSWPSAHIEPQRFALNALGPDGPGTLDGHAGPEARLNIVGLQTTGADSGVWCAYGLPGDLPGDQRADDGQSLCFTSAPLAQPVEILGFPRVTLTLAANRPQALVAVRLCDVSPTGASTLVSRGLLNLTHRDGHARPSPLQPGPRYTVTLTLDAIGYALPAGHRWRVAVSPTYWPHAWPSPEPVTLSVFTGGPAPCALELPVRAPQEADAHLPPFGPPEHARPLESEILRLSLRRRTVHRDVALGSLQLVDHNDHGARRFTAQRNGLEDDSVSTDTYTIVEGDPLSATARSQWSIRIGRGAWRTRVETTSEMACDAHNFFVTNVLHAYEGNAQVFSKTWTFSVPRDGV